MRKNHGPGTAATMELEYEAKLKQLSADEQPDLKHVRALVKRRKPEAPVWLWIVPCTKAIRLAIKHMDQPKYQLLSAIGNSMNVVRTSTSITLSYSLHSSKVMSLVYVTIQVTSSLTAVLKGLPLGNPPPQYVPEWSIDLSASPWFDASIPPVTIPWDFGKKGPTARISISEWTEDGLNEVLSGNVSYP